MVRGERKQPIWSTIPVPGLVTARRDSTRQQRKHLLQRRQEEEEEERRRRREQKEAAKILARRWMKEDRGNRRAVPSSSPPEPLTHRWPEARLLGRRGAAAEGAEGDAAADEDQGPRRGRLLPRRAQGPDAAFGHDDDEPPSMATPSEARVRSTRPTGAQLLGYGPDRHRGCGEGRTYLGIETYQEVQDFRENRDAPTAISDLRKSTRPDAQQERSTSQAAGAEVERGAGEAPRAVVDRPLVQGSAPSVPVAKIAGVFGLSDSDDERESARREMELAARTKRTRLTMHARATAPPASSSSSATTGSERALMTAEVHMKYAQWKQSCKNRYVPMPEDLKRAVATVMGNRTAH